VSVAYIACCVIWKGVCVCVCVGREVLPVGEGGGVASPPYWYRSVHFTLCMTGFLLSDVHSSFASDYPCFRSVSLSLSVYTNLALLALLCIDKVIKWSGSIRLIGNEAVRRTYTAMSQFYHYKQYKWRYINRWLCEGRHWGLGIATVQNAWVLHYS
jgi:hypothetical protein